MNPEKFIGPICQLAKDAGNAILSIYNTEFDIKTKSDNSPLTQADLTSHKIIEKGLKKLSPEIPIISEEQGLTEFNIRKKWKRYWLIDPLDGTKEFVKKNGEFTVNIALIEENKPIFGVVHGPVIEKTYVGCIGIGSFIINADGKEKKIHIASKSSKPIKVVGSRSHRGNSLDALENKLGKLNILPMGSSLKFCIVAEGRADIYPRLGPTSEWDTGAAQAVVEQAGGVVLRLDGSPLSYNEKDDILNPYFLVAGPMDKEWLKLINEK